MIKETDLAFMSRCIIITMIKNVRNIKFRIDRKTAESLKSQLFQWQKDTLHTPLFDAAAHLIDVGIRDYRLIQILNPILAVVPRKRRAKIIGYGHIKTP